MATQGGTIQFGTAVDLTGLKQGMNQAARIGRQSLGSRGALGGHGAGAGFMGGFTSAGHGSAFERMFARRPGLRAEHALGQSLTSLMQGDIGSAVQGLALKSTGLGLLLGAGVMAAAEGYKILAAQIKEAHKAHNALGSELSKPIAGIMGLGAAGIEQHIETTQKLTEASTAAAKAPGNILFQRTKAAFGALIHGKNPFAAGDAAENKAGFEDAAAGMHRAHRLQGALADEEESDLAAHLEGSDQGDALRKIRKAADEKKAKLTESLGGNPLEAANLFRRRQTLEREAQLEMADVSRKFQFKMDDAEMGHRFLDRQYQFTPGKAHVENLKDKKAVLEARMNAPGLSNEERTALGLEIHGIDEEELHAEYAESKKKPGQLRREQKERDKFEAFVKRTHPGPREVGLHTGGLEIGHVQGASLADDAAFTARFPATSQTPFDGRSAVTAMKEEQQKNELAPLTQQDMDRLLQKYFGQN